MRMAGWDGGILPGATYCPGFEGTFCPGVLQGLLWYRLQTFGNFWLRLATFGNFWQRLATFGNFWQLLAT